MISSRWRLRAVPGPDEILRLGEQLRETWAGAGRLVVGPVAYCDLHDLAFFFACPGCMGRPR